ncbi:unnamed protein product, partial [Mesorhabditis spiculigera]
MRSLLIFALLTASVVSWMPLPLLWSQKQKKDTCKDYCMGKFISDQTNFDFQAADWEICVCPVAQQSGSWFQSQCYNNCFDRCLNTMGACAWNQALNLNYKGRCCINTKNNATLKNYCFNNQTGLCYQT